MRILNYKRNENTVLKFLSLIKRSNLYKPICFSNDYLYCDDRNLIIIYSYFWCEM